MNAIERFNVKVETCVGPGGVVWERIEFPTGHRILYIDSNHSYWLAKADWSRGKRLPSVSSLVKPLDHDQSRLHKWFCRQSMGGVAELYNRHISATDSPALDWMDDGEVIWARLENAKLTPFDTRDRKAKTGTAVHDCLLSLATKTDHWPDLKTISDEERGYTQALMRWWESRRPEVLNAEQFVYSPTYEYAGRFDLRARIDGAVTLLDLKTSGWISPSYHAQLQGYRLAAEDCGIGESDRLVILQVGDDGSFREVPCQATGQDFVDAVSTYRASQRISREARKAAA